MWNNDLRIPLGPMPISDEQLAFNQALHQSNPSFGNRDQAAGMAATLPLALYRTHELGFCSSVLDYGTGKGLLVDRLRAELPPSIRVDGYDPAIQKWSQKPSVVPDILLCLDVLEHIENPAEQLIAFHQRLSVDSIALMNWFFFKGNNNEYPFHFDDKVMVEEFFRTLQTNFLEVFHPFLITTRAYKPIDLH